jgi:lysophospholipase L1-like esterase
VRRALAAAAAGLVLAVLGLLGGRPVGAAPVAPAQPSPQRLLVVGDSVLAGVPAAGALRDLEAALPGWQVTFDAKECRSIQGPRKACGNEPGTVSGGLEEVQAQGTAFQAVVLQLGTNDAADPASAQHTIDSAKAILDLLKQVPHVYWMTIREAGHYQAGYAEFNRLLRELPQSYPNLTVIDWAVATKDRPELFGGDGLHLNNAGASYAASVIAGAVKGQLDPAVPVVVATTSPASTASSSSSSPASSASAAPPATAKASAASSSDTTNIIIGVAVALVLVAGIVVAVLAGRRRERKHRREERTARVEAELARSAEARKQQQASELDEVPPPPDT